MGYLTAKQFSKIWGITERRIIKLCNENRISGAIKNGMIWEIPESTLKPSDKRSNIYKYINVEKRTMVVNCKEEIKGFLQEEINKQGYIAEFLNNKEGNNYSQYYEGLIYFSNNEENKNGEIFIKEFCNKLNFESSIVVVSNKNKIEKKFAEKIKKEIGLRINTLILNISENDTDINYDEISEDIMKLLTNFKNTNGAVIITDGGKLTFNNDRKTKNLSEGEFYNAINNYFKRLNTNSYLWCASTMLEDEWTEEPQEMKFRLINLEAANRGVKIERIFIFSNKRIKEFRNNKTLKIYMQSNINTMYVDYDEILTKQPKLLEIVGAGWDGIDKDILIADLPEGMKERGYISKNTKEVMKAYNCFQELKKYSKKLREVL